MIPSDYQCEDWLRSVAAEEWSSTMLEQLPNVTSACLNALLLAMIGSASAAPQFEYRVPPPPPVSHDRYDRSEPLESSGAPPVPESAHRMVETLRRTFGNRPTEVSRICTHHHQYFALILNSYFQLLGALSTANQKSSITRSAQKSRYLGAEELQVRKHTPTHIQLGIELGVG